MPSKPHEGQEIFIYYKPWVNLLQSVVRRRKFLHKDLPGGQDLLRGPKTDKRGQDAEDDKDNGDDNNNIIY